MNPHPNLAGLKRLGYVIVGSALIIWGIFYADPGLLRQLALVAGAVVLVEGLIGYCVACAMLSLGGNKESPQQ